MFTVIGFIQNYKIHVNRIHNTCFIVHRHRFHTQDNMAYQSIADKYAGKSVFMTGATGFLGKVIHYITIIQKYFFLNII